MRSTKIKKKCSSSLWTCLHNMVILRSQNKIIDFFMILAWYCLFKYYHYLFSFATHFKSPSSTTSRELRLVVDEDDNGKFRIERVNGLKGNI